MAWRQLTVAGLTLAATVHAGLAQQPAPQRAPGALTGGVTAVFVDVVVRDKKNQPVRNLTEADFEVFEDGVPQTIDSFGPVRDGVTIQPPAVHAAAPAAPAPPAAPPRAPRPTGSKTVSVSGAPVTALVFHGLDLDARRRTVEAAQTYVGAGEVTDNYTGVFEIGTTLRPLVPFTRNGVAVRQALKVIASGSGPVAEAVAERAPGDVLSPGRPIGGAGGGGADAMLQSMAAEMLDGLESLGLDFQGYIATDALSVMVRTMGRLPGRKSIVFFSTGIPLTTAVYPRFLGVIDAANRTNVSIYTVDAAGLRTGSAQQQAHRRISKAASIGYETGYAGEISGPLGARVEAIDYGIRSDPHFGLGMLAEDTGGLLLDQTNNFRPAFDGLNRDLRNYYMLGYTPLKRTFDGKFRTIQVKVKRPGVTVAARKGYFAIRNPGDMPLSAWEAPALGALEEKPLPNAFPIRVGVFLFPERGRPGLVPVVAEVPTAPLTFQPTADGKSYTSDFNVLVRFLDGENQVVRKLSQHYEIRGELTKIDGAKRGQVVFYRESELPPGVYSMETVVHDALAGKASVRLSTVEVPRHEEGRLRVSSLMLVTRGEQVTKDEQRAGNPLLVNGVALQPNLIPRVRRDAKEAGFYFTIYPVAGSKPEVTIQLVQNGRLISETAMEVTASPTAERIQQLGRLPLDTVAPGTYELRAVVKQGPEQLLRSTTVTVE